MSDEPLDPAAAQIIGKVRRLMLISGLVTMLAIAGIIGVIGYRVFQAQESAAEETLALPQGARVTGVSAAEDRLVVTLDNAGVTEIRTFDLRTLKPRGRLTLQPRP
jgi:hypothetical protein